MRAIAVTLLLGLGVLGCGQEVAGQAVDASPVPPDAAIDAAPSCELVAQQGCDDGEKCTFVAAGSGFVNACVPSTGQVPIGAPCTRDPVLGHGHDDCAPGGFCSFIGVLPPSAGGTRRCRAVCGGDADCAAGERCALVGVDHGMCTTPCAAFAACPDGLTCADLWDAVEGGRLLVCRTATAAAAGNACDAHDACGPDQICFIDGRCRTLCDAAHACPGGDRCVVLDQGLGVCP